MQNVRWVFVVAAVGMVFGCGGGEKVSSREKVYPVTGKILYKGSPVASADVTFFCAEKNRSAFGRTNEQGMFTLTTYASNDGAVAGKHIVVVTKIQATAPPKKVADISDRAYEPPKQDESTDPAPPANSVPAKYGDAKTSDLIAVVSSDQPNSDLALELKD